ncbi:MAG: aldo/keto reductase [Myxococcota bacterium]
MSLHSNSGPIPGRATPEGTRRYAARAPACAGHFRAPDRLLVSSLALGTRQGAPGGVDDLLYRSALETLLEAGCNVVDTALSDRMQTSERAVGAALARAIASGLVARDEVVVVTKGGALTADARFAQTRAEVHRNLVATYLESGLVDPDRLVGGHCMQPRFLRDQIARSRANLGLETIDFYLVQEPELHLRELGPDGFRDALVETFAALEDEVAHGHIAAYGVCTWNGFLVPHTEREHLSVFDVFEAALEAGSGDHHLRAVQMPYGLAVGEGAALASQLSGGATASVVELLVDTGTLVLASAPLFGGRIVGHVPAFVRAAYPETRGDAQCALQFARSTHGVSTVVVGLREPAHVDAAVALARTPPAEPAIAAGLFRAAAARAR